MAEPLIAALRLVPYAIPLSRPWKCARGDTVMRRGWLVRVEDSEGAHGWGETAGLPGAGTETAALAEAALRAAVKEFAGLTPAEAHARLPLHDRPAARCGLECALLDLAARRAGQPLYRHLRPEAAGEVRVNAFVGAADEGLGDRLVAARAQGFEVAKLKLATAPLAEEMPLFFAAMEQLPLGLSLRLDVNRGWSTVEAEATLPRFADLPIEALEEPAHDADGEALARLQSMVSFSIALDESLARWPDEGPLPVRRQILKPMVVGGPSRVFGLALRPRTESIVTSSVDTAVGLWLSAHIGAALGNGLAHGLDTASWLSTLLGPAPTPGGVLRLPDAPGLGFEPELP
ncbi:MAG TPA: enolase C-terminal domain-like protein [Gammaproteobacteria bacterium]|nr:enolase C-terminal domain-like protein [Gammaproteobacteria bacterium]